MILGIVQARVSSTRLPGKVLKRILGVPMIIRQAERIKRSSAIDRLIVATSVNPSDDAVEKVCLYYGVECFRGSLDDVMNRFYQAAVKYDPDHIVRLTGDCPLADPWIIDRVVACHLQGGYDYTSNTVEPTFPDGLDVEVFSFLCLAKAYRDARLPSQREHVTLYMYQNPDLFRIGSLKDETDLSGLRWTVDEQADYDFVKRVYEELYPANPGFTTGDILRLLDENPGISNLDDVCLRNKGLLKSLQEDLKKSS